MSHLLDLALLKEYVQTLTNGEISFPGTTSRAWGCDFSRSEQQRIGQCLRGLARLAPLEQYSPFVNQGNTGIELNTVHWLPVTFWMEVATWLNEEPVRH